VWFTDSSNPGAIGRIDPTSGQVSEFITGLTKDRKPTGITAGADGAMWFTEAANPGAIGRITTSGAISEFSAGLTPDTRPLGIAAGADGALWFTQEGNPGAIGRITTAGTISEFTAGMSTNSRPTGITAADDGNLHFTEAASPGRIATITPAGVISELATPTGNSQPSGIAEGPDGNLWVTEVGAHGQIATVTVAPGTHAAAASAVAEQAATLHAEVRPNSQATVFDFEYGTTSSYGSQTASTSAGSGAVATAVSAPIVGLTPGTAYHFRVRATNAAGTSYGPDTTFLTVAAPTSETPAATALTPSTPVAATLVTAPTSPVTPPSTPALGRTALVSVVSGTVTVAVPGSAPKPLASAKDIPVGSVIDATRGVLRLTTALDRRGHVQSATIWGAAFAIAQSATRHGMTTMTLGGASACRVPARVARAVVAARRTPTLWAKDNHGHFSTRGQNSVATVRGTYWGTQNSCGGTWTIVRQGGVSVRDLKRHRTVLVRAGHSYLARR
jgi:streptogramin lyase